MSSYENQNVVSCERKHDFNVVDNALSCICLYANKANDEDNFEE